MSLLNVPSRSGPDVQISFEDSGQGRPVLLIHGWPFDSGMWEKQVPALLAGGYRVITYDRRGMGKSSAPFEGYDYDTLTGDLDLLIESLGLNDVALVGFSMGGGEVARYLGKFNKGRVTKAVMIAAIPPALVKSENNPEGADIAIFDDIRRRIEADRFNYLETFVREHNNFGILPPEMISEGKTRADFASASQSSYQAMRYTVDAWLEDFRDDLKATRVPILSIHGDHDQMLPLAVSADRIPGLVPTARLLVIKDGPHGLIWTHAEQVNQAMLEFLSEPTGQEETALLQSLSLADRESVSLPLSSLVPEIATR